MIRPVSQNNNRFEPIRAAIEQRGLTAVARELGMPRLTIASALLNIGHESTQNQLALRWERLTGQVLQ